LVGDFDVADLALRTCLCGHRIEGFDGYHAHLVSLLGESDLASARVHDA
jgi:hypothetical protein